MLGSLSTNQSSPRHSYHCNRQDPHWSWTETSKPSLPFRHTAVTTDALSPSGRFPGPPPVPHSQQCHKEEVLHQRELQAPLHPITAAVNSTKGPPEGSVPPEHPGRCWQPAVAPAQGTQLSFKALQVLHLRCEPLKSFILLFLFFFFFWTRKWQINFKFKKKTGNRPKQTSNIQYLQFLCFMRFFLLFLKKINSD